MAFFLGTSTFCFFTGVSSAGVVAVAAGDHGYQIFTWDRVWHGGPQIGSKYIGHKVSPNRLWRLLVPVPQLGLNFSAFFKFSPLENQAQYEQPWRSQLPRSYKAWFSRGENLKNAEKFKPRDRKSVV